MVWYALRKPPPGLLQHSDQSRQYLRHEYRQTLEAYGMRSSMSRVGACWDNAVVESFFKSLKVERVYRVSYQSRAQPTADVAAYINDFYNSTRRHSHIDYQSPVDCEKANTYR